MTTMQNEKAVAQTQPDQGFPSIPTRIRDTRDGQVPPLLVEPVAEPESAAIVQNLSELGLKMAEIHRTAAEAYLSQGLFDQSLPHLEAAVTFAPSESDYHQQLGFVQYVTGDDEGATKSFNAVIEADADNGEGWFNLGMVLFGQEQFVDAETCFARACQLEGKDAQLWNNRGVCLYQVGKVDDARTCFQNALQLDPADEDAKFNLQNIG